jgi:hypothetical protein
MRKARVGDGLLEDVVAEALRVDGDNPKHEPMVSRLVAALRAPAERAAIAARGGYSEQWARVVSTSERGLAREPSALAAFRLFCRRLLAAAAD